MAWFGFVPDRTPEPAVPAVETPAEAARLAALQPAHPAPRELRAQAVHRLQIGLFGLAGMLLLVSLANVIMDRAKQVERTTTPVAAVSPSPSPSTANDPLVDMGVAPELPVTGGGGSGAKPARPAPRPAGN